MKDQRIAAWLVAIVALGALAANYVDATFRYLNGNVNHVQNVMAPPYLAVGDNVTDDFPAIMSAYAATAGIAYPPVSHTNFTSTMALSLPHPTNCYAISQPVRFFAQNSKISGDNHSKLCPTYYGHSIDETGWGATPPTFTTNLVTGLGQGLVEPLSPRVQYFIDFLNADSSNNFAVKNSSAFTIEGFFQPTTADGGQMWCSWNLYPGTSSAISGNTNGAFCIQSNGSAFDASVNTTGGLINLNVCSNYAIGTIYHLAVTWDGATYRLRQGAAGGNSTVCSSVSSANPPTQKITESLSFPMTETPGWFDRNNGQGAQPGVMSSFRISNIDRYGSSTFAVPSADLPFDANTYYLTNFETIQDGNILKGYAQPIVNTVPTPVYSMDNAYDIGYTSGSRISDIDWCGGNYADGLFAQGSDDSIWDNDKCSQAFFNQFDADANDFQATLSNYTGFGGYAGLVYGTAWNNGQAIHNHVDTATISVVRVGGGGEDDHTEITDRGSTVIDFLGENSDSGQITDLTIDQEAGNTVLLAGIWERGPGQLVFQTGDLPALNGAPNYLQDFPGLGPVFIGVNFITDATVPELIKYTNGTPTGPSLLMGVTTSGNTNYSNLVSPSYVNSIGGALDH